MLKNLIIYRIVDGTLPTIEEAEKAIAAAPYIEAAKSANLSCGFIPPRGLEHGAFVESVWGHWIIRHMLEVRTVPSAAIQRRVDELKRVIEESTGRKPGRKETMELKEQANLELLPNAFSNLKQHTIWIDPNAGTLAVDAGSQAAADVVVSDFIKAVDGVALALLDIKTSPQAAMAHWLKSQEPPAGFSIDRECELKSAGEDKAVVRYARHPLDIEEVQAHIEAGKLPTKLAMSWDDRVSFVLTEGLQLKKIAFLDDVFADPVVHDKNFDADVAFATGEFSQLILDLVKALGGENRPAGVRDDDGTPLRRASP